MAEQRQDAEALRRARSLATLAVHRGAAADTWIEVRGSSMRPLIHDGDRLWVETPRARPRLGEIVVFPDRDILVAHRLVGRTRRQGRELLLTVGDGMAELDRPFPPERTLGVVRSCRRGSDGVATPVLDQGPAAVTLALASRASAELVRVCDRLSPAFGHRPARVMRRLGSGAVARLALVLARPPKHPAGMSRRPGRAAR